MSASQLVRASGALLVFCLSLTSDVCAAPLYSVANLGAVGPNYSSATAINNYGQVTGSTLVGSEFRAFLWTPTTPHGTVGSMQDLGTLPNGYTTLNGLAINDFG